MKGNIKTFFALHMMLLLYSAGPVFSKLAAAQAHINARFLVCYGMVVLLLGLYAIGWQQIIKRLPLTTAFSNKAVTVVWGIIWGALFFHESVTIGKLIGAALIVTGIVIYSGAEGDQQHE